MRIRERLIEILDRPRAGETHAMWQMRRLREISEGSTVRILRTVQPEEARDLGEDPIGPITGARLIRIDLRERGERD